MKKVLFLSLLGIIVTASSCSNNKSTENQQTATEAPTTESPQTTEPAPASGNPSYDPNRGEGKFKDYQVDPKLNPEMADAGGKIYEVKCASCHKLTDEKLVGPGWLGVTTRRQPSWILNFITNPDEMLNKDPAAQAMLEICLVRMPNQNLTDDDAKKLLEFMRKNDGVKP